MSATQPIVQNPEAFVSCARKRAFGSRKIAKGHAVNALKVQGVPMKPYRCSHCGLWHLFTDRKEQFKNYKRELRKLVPA